MPRKPTAKSEEKRQCHVHDKVGDWQIEDIREKVCVKESDFPLKEHTDGKHYCLFHLPTKEKDAGRFEEIFRARLQAVEEKITAVEKLPEDEQAVAKRGVYYNFRYVWFPSKVNLRHYKFSAVADFDSATFSANADFRLATFSDFAYFSKATFSNDANFFLAKFTETSQIFFEQTNICQTMILNYTVFAGYVAFEGYRNEKVFPEDDTRKAILDLQNARLEKPERISFHRVRLRPSWFVNTDSRKMVFTDISWDKLDAERGNSNIFDEIKSLREREISEPRRLLEIACRELAVNAEENNRYEEASKFRYMAMETKRLEYKWQGRLWTLS